MRSDKRVRLKSRSAARKDDGTQLKRLRRLCLSFPGTMEKISHGEATVFTTKRVWLPASPGVQEALVEEEPQIYFRPPYVGPAGWIGVELSKVDDDQLGSMISEAFHLMVAKDRGAGARKSSKPGRSRKAVR